MTNESRSSYSYSKSLAGQNFESVLAKVITALKTEGFGVLTEIDVAETLKKKLDVHFRRYKILGACNPSLAHQALLQELLVGLFMPCNVIVFEDGDDIVVAIGKPEAMFQPIGNSEMGPLIQELDAKIARILEQLT